MGKGDIKPRWKPGQSGNPAGRPKGIPNAKTRYKRLLELVEKTRNPVTGEMEDFTVAEILDMVQIKNARNGKLDSYKEIMNRLEGLPAQSLDVTSGGDKLEPIVIYRPEKLKDDNTKTK